MKKTIDFIETLTAWFILGLMFLGVPTFLFVHSIVTVWE